MNLTFVHHRRVPWCETDGSGTLHFSNYVRYMEETEYAFLRSVGLSVVLNIDSRGTIGFPRLMTEFEIVSPARFDDLLEIKMRLAHNDGKSIRYEFILNCCERSVANGIFQVACCRFPDSRPPFAIPIPDQVLNVIPLC